MKTVLGTLSRQRFPYTKALAVAFVISFSLTLTAQQPGSSSVATEHAAMQKLSFLTGHWSGPITLHLGPGKTLHLTQTENVEYKLDGLIMLVQGKSTSADGKVRFNALATIAYDDASQTYRFRAYNDGRYIDTQLSVPANGLSGSGLSGNSFSWGFMAGPMHIENTMHLTAQGKWNEVTDATMGSNPPYRSMEMLLQHHR